MSKRGSYSHPFSFSPTSSETIAGTLTLEPTKKPLLKTRQTTLVRSGQVTTPSSQIAVQLYSNLASNKLLYLHQEKLSATLAEVLGVSKKLIGKKLTLPGQVLLGGARVAVINQGVAGILHSEPLCSLIAKHDQKEVVIVPVLREGVKYQIAEMLFADNGYYCEEVVVDAHHVIDTSVKGYGRRVDVTAFKDVDLTDEERARIKVAIVGDSTASGIVIIGLLEKLKERFTNLEQVEIIAPLATVFACARISLHVPAGTKFKLRIHAFETLLNSVEPDYYWSPHFTQPELHIKSRLQKKYRNWWGQDSKGNWIADTACAGYGWSEAFFHPQKFVRMMNTELQRRHGLTIAQIIERF